jgi:hypothetical protein
MKAKNKHKQIVKAIQLAWSSLDSHLEYTDKPYKRGEPKRFHITAIKEYAVIINTLADLL